MDARGFGIGAKLCDHIENLARLQNRNLYLGKRDTDCKLVTDTSIKETSMAQLPAMALYRKLGYRGEPKPHSWLISLVVWYKVLN